MWEQLKGIQMLSLIDSVPGWLIASVWRVFNITLKDLGSIVGAICQKLEKNKGNIRETKKNPDVDIGHLMNQVTNLKFIKICLNYF